MILLTHPKLPECLLIGNGIQPQRNVVSVRMIWAKTLINMKLSN